MAGSKTYCGFVVFLSLFSGCGHEPEPVAPDVVQDSHVETTSLDPTATTGGSDIQKPVHEAPPESATVIDANPPAKESPQVPQPATAPPAERAGKSADIVLPSLDVSALTASCLRFVEDDSKLLVSGLSALGTHSTPLIADVNSREILFRFRGTVAGRHSAVTPDEVHVATGGVDSTDAKPDDIEQPGAVYIHRVADGHEIAVLHGHRHPVNSCDFSATGRLISASSGEDSSEVRIWIGEDYDLKNTLEFDRLVYHAWYATDETQIILVTQHGFEVVRSEDGSIIRSHDFSNPRFLRHALAPDRKLLAVATTDGEYDAPIATTVELFDVATTTLVRAKRIPNVRTGTLVFSRDGSRLALGTENLHGLLAASPDIKASVTVFNSNDLSQVLHASDYRGHVTGMAFSDSGERLAISDLNGVHLLDLD